jgi:hypothetical protein
MQKSWDEVRIGLLALGYRELLYVEIVCISCGRFRGAVEDDEVFPCPTCHADSVLTFCAEGFTRRGLPAWERVETPLSPQMRAKLMGEDFGEDVVFHRQQRRQRVENEKITREVARRGRSLDREPVDLRAALR